MNASPRGTWQMVSKLNVMPISAHPRGSMKSPDREMRRLQTSPRGSRPDPPRFGRHIAGWSRRRGLEAVPRVSEALLVLVNAARPLTGRSRGRCRVRGHRRALVRALRGRGRAERDPETAALRIAPRQAPRPSTGSSRGATVLDARRGVDPGDRGDPLLATIRSTSTLRERGRRSQRADQQSDGSRSQSRKPPAAAEFGAEWTSSRGRWGASLLRARPPDARACGGISYRPPESRFAVYGRVSTRVYVHEPA